MVDIAFTLRLAEADWDSTIRGWRCPVLAVPGAVIIDLFVTGDRVDRAKYEVLSDALIIRWIPADQPERAVASVKLTKNLTTAAATERWKNLAIILPVVATIAAAAISGIATYYSAKEKAAPSPVGLATGDATPKPAEVAAAEGQTTIDSVASNIEEKRRPCCRNA